MNSLYNLSRKGIFLFILCFPIILFSQDHNPLEISLNHLESKQEIFGLTKTDISNYRISDSYTSKHNGVTHIYLQQQQEGIDLQNAIININVLPNGKILNSGNRFSADLKNRINSSSPSIEPIQALQTVINKFHSTNSKPIRIQEKVNDKHSIFEHEGIALSPINVRLKYGIQKDNSIRLMWEVGFYQLDAQHFWNVQIDAMDGKILDYFDEVIHCNFDHTHDNCHEKSNKKNTNADANTPTFWEKAEKANSGESSLIMANTYNVFPMPIESPKHGARAMITDPANLVASPFGWHDTDGMDGAEYTITQGNNVHAYHDIFSQNKSIGGEPDGGANLEFDFPFDINNDTTYQATETSIVNLFYWNNLVHDVYYQYGFDEVSGNFQTNNYDNGGVGNDYVRAEAMDGSGTNNANFFTPADGQRPRMQMFIWNGSNNPGQPNRLIVTDTSGAVNEYNMMPAGFGSTLPETPIISELVLVDDGIDNIFDACENIGNGNEVEGKIALLDRGTNGCQNGTQVLKAQNAGAVGVVVCNTGNGIFTMSSGNDGDQVTIPAVMINAEDCDSIKLYLPTLTVALGAPDFTIPTPGPFGGFDSDFDNGVIVHEYGHGISNRLTGGPSATNCLRNMEQAGEGWSDWFGLVMTSTSSDNAEQGRGIGTYVNDEETNGLGIREFQYSRDMLLNPHVYTNINTGSVPHGVGSVWAVMIWDLYWNMIDVYGFDDDIYNGSGGNNITIQLVMDGLKLQTCSPTFLDSRDAILAADIANNDGANQCLIWETFARRGLGVSAKVGGTVAYDVPLDCQFRLKINKTTSNEISAGEILTYSIEVSNDSPNALTNLTITDQLPDGVELIENSMTCSDFSFDNSVLTIEIGDLESGASTTCTYDVLVLPNPFSYITFEDDIENGITNWVATAGLGTNLWEISDNSYEGDNAWYFSNGAYSTDSRLTTASSFELGGANPSLSFWHRYDTDSNRDGGRVELSTDGGVTWNDLRFDFTQNAYNGVMLNSILTGEFGFTGKSDGYINTVADLSEYSGETVMIRFRFVSNDTEEADGWYVDNVRLFGDYREVINEACVSSDLNENECDSATSTVFGDPSTSNKNLESSLDVSIFPNPTEGKVFLKLENTFKGSTIFKLNSLDGRVLKTKEVDFSNGVFEFDLSNFPKGIYLIQIQNEETQIVRKIVLQ
ncbi:MAG: M36 family metallopeptidase [Saprospiraceae bacterium]